MSEAKFVFVQELHDPTVVAQVKGLLETAGIEFFIQGEHHAAMLAGFLGHQAVTPRLMVAVDQAEQVRALLAEVTSVEPTESQLKPDGAVCAVHERPAIATCGRCGSFLCADCGAVGDPPLCESCVASEAPQRSVRRAKTDNRKRLVVYVVLAPVLLALLLAALTALASLLRL